MRAVMVSIRPKWVELIAARKKTLEVRKDMPKRVKTPFVCYIYQTRETWACSLLRRIGLEILADRLENAGGMIAGEFVCDAIMLRCEMANMDLAIQHGCIKEKDLVKYSAGKELFGWHISDLKIYKTPKKLSEFKRVCINELRCEGCALFSNNGGTCGNDALYLKRPPQSWCYVEEAET